MNTTTRALIDPNGAELKSLIYRDREYLWQGSPQSWKDRSPQLFPVIGTTIPGGWTYKGRTISLENHGFARTSEFDVLQSDDRSCRLRLGHSPETMEHYPFSFFLDIAFTLDDAGLKVDYTVVNPDEEDLLFSLGAHPGFNCPLEEGAVFEDYYLEFSEKESISRRYKDYYLTGERENILQNANRISLDYGLFERGAVILSGLKSSRVCLKSDKSDPSVTMDFSGFPSFGVWTAAGKKAPYVCLEPWFGVDSTEGDPPEFEKKEGLVRLEGKGEFACSYSLSLT